MEVLGISSSGGIRGSGGISSSGGIRGSGGISGSGGAIPKRRWCKKRRDKPGMGLEAHFMTYDDCETLRNSLFTPMT